jgi:hypothetical protein
MPALAQVRGVALEEMARNCAEYLPPEVSVFCIGWYGQLQVSS